MTPIISPWIFYVASIVGNIRIITGILLFAAIILTAIIFWQWDENTKMEKQDKKWLKKAIITATITLLLVLTIPTEATVNKMIAAKFATKQNIDTVYDKIIDSAAKLGEAWNADK